MTKQQKVWITIRLTVAERDLIATAAEQYNMSMQNFIVAAAEENAKRVLAPEQNLTCVIHK